MGQIDPSSDDVAEVVEDFRRLAEENRDRYAETDGEEGDLTAAAVYEDAANHVEDKLLNPWEGYL